MSLEQGTALLVRVSKTKPFSPAGTASCACGATAERTLALGTRKRPQSYKMCAESVACITALFEYLESRVESRVSSQHCELPASAPCPEGGEGT